MSRPTNSCRLLLMPALVAMAAPVAWAQLLPGQVLPGQLQPGQVAAPGSSFQAPVGSGPAGTSTQVFPNPPGPGGAASLPGGSYGTGTGQAGLSGLTTPGSSTGSSSSTGLSSSLGPTGLLPGSPNPTSAASPNVPGYAAPASTALPGYTAPPGSLGFPPVTSVPGPGTALTPITPVAPGDFTGSSGNLGTSGSGSGILTRPGP